MPINVDGKRIRGSKLESANRNCILWDEPIGIHSATTEKTQWYGLGIEPDSGTSRIFDGTMNRERFIGGTGDLENETQLLHQ